MNYTGSSITLSDPALQGATRAAALMRKSQQANIEADGVDASISAAYAALSKYQPATTSPSYQAGSLLTVTQATTPATFTGALVARTDAGYDYWGTSPGTINASYTGATVGAGRQFKTEFETNSNNLAFRVLNTGSHLQVYVDGRRVSNADITMNGGTANSLVYVIEVNLAPVTDSAGVPVYRHISLTGYNQAFGGCFIDTGSSLRKPTGKLAISKSVRAWQLGDSYTLGVGPTDPSFIDFRHVCDHLGWVGLANGISGSGWNSTAGQYPTTRINSELANCSYLPDYVILALGFNDAGGNMTTLKSSMREAIAAIRKIVPAAKLIGYGTATPVGGTANLALVEAALKEVYAEQRIPFISLYDVVNAANSKFYTISDNTHPSDAGHRIRAAAIADEIVKYV